MFSFEKKKHVTNYLVVGLCNRNSAKGNYEIIHAQTSFDLSLR